MNEDFAMHPGDTFVADQCGCQMTVVAGPHDDSSVKQAPQCCCGHAMHKVSSSRDGSGTAPAADPTDTDAEYTRHGAPAAMAD